MKILDKKQIVEKLGKFGFWSGKEESRKDLLYNELKYLGGISSIDELFENKTLHPLCYQVPIRMRPKGIEINFQGINLIPGFKSKYYRIGILREQLNFWTIEQQNEIIAKKNKSIIGRALLGGVLFGPAGAIVGGMTGIGDRKIKVSDIDNFVSVSYNEDSKEIMILFSCKDRSVKKVYECFKENLPDKYKSPEEIKYEEQKPLTENKIFIADEIKKLKELVDNGILTNEEFEEQKKKILNY